MAISGFEGFEKRLELRFSGDDPMSFNLGLRRLDFELLEEVLTAVQCTVVSAMGNRYFDSYVLSESSLFVYPTKIIIKTCGTTQLLKSVPLLVALAENMGFHVCGCRYTRGKFIFPKAQPFPHTSFREEVFYLEQNLPSNLCYRKACVLPHGKKKFTKGNSSSSTSHSWHVYTAFEHEYEQVDDDHLFTMEVCMTELDRVLARKFFGRPGVVYSGDLTGKEMTESTGIGKINPKALVCDYGFDPCGYSMNSIDGNNYATIHVTPEDGYSYGSFECVGSCSNDVERIGDMMEKVVKIFRPGMMSVSITGGVNREMLWKSVSDAVESFGLKCSSCTFDELPGAGTVVFQTFMTSSRRNKLSE